LYAPDGLGDDDVFMLDNDENVIHISGQPQPIIGSHHEFKFMARLFQNP